MKPKEDKKKLNTDLNYSTESNKSTKVFEAEHS